jgi:glycosyl transferase family 25
MEARFHNLELEFEFIVAVDGKTLSENDLAIYSKTIALRDFGRELTPGELGCAFSHIKMWQKLVNSDYEEVLILEDDVLIGRALIDILHNRNKLPKDYQHVNFSTKAKQQPTGDFVTDIYRASNHMERAYSSEAYLITKSGAQRLLDLVNPLYMPIDNFITIAGIVSYGIFPSVAVSAGFSSSIGRRLDNMPKVTFGQKKWRQFKEILKSIAIFFGATEQSLINAHLKINKILKR